MNKLLIFGLLIAATAIIGEAKRYCQADADCADLGGLQCLKSICKWGTCGCPRGFGAKYVGSERLFRCVPLRKINETCSNHGEHGICAAQNSFCNEQTHRCSCEDWKVPVWGGERCEERQRTTAGETCSSSIGTCSMHPSSCQANSLYSAEGAYAYNLIKMDEPICSCANAQKLALYNHVYAFPYVGRKEPICEQNGVGDHCFRDGDCPGLNMECISNKCACLTGFVPSYDMKVCKKALDFGAKCTGASYDASYHCDGSKGLVCGDLCEEDPDFTIDRTCQCGPGYTGGGSSCSKRGLGSVCYGDANCHAWNPNGICVEGKCANGATVFQISTVAMILMVLVWAFK